MKTDWLSQQVTERRAIPFKFAGHMMIADARSAVYWLEQDILIVSDLHLEKGSYLGQYANPIPHYDSRKTLTEVMSLIDDYQPKTLVSLGDSFHDRQGFNRMQQQEMALLEQAISKVEDWVWILGNHDPELPDEAQGKQMVEWLVDNVLLVHEPTDDERIQIMGHYHPKAWVKSGKLKVRGRSLLCSDSHMIMPAFGQYTGGLDSEHEVISDVFGMKARSGFVFADGRVFPL